MPGFGHLAECSNCGLIQKTMDADLQAELDAIYKTYYPYKNDQEPLIFSSDVRKSRSQEICAEIDRFLDLGNTGKHIDIGCGTGEFLTVFCAVKPRWTSFGFDLNKNYVTQIETICGPETFLSGSLNDLPEGIDLITLNYVLEHISDPAETLDLLSRKLSPTGTIVLIVPDIARNPYDLVVADHLSHYSNRTLSLQSSNLLIVGSQQFLRKELILYGRRNDGMGEVAKSSTDVLNAKACNYVRYLIEVRASALESASRYPEFGIFGTAIAGSWLGSELCGVDFVFVDEDSRKWGTRHLNRPVVAPADMSPEACIFVPADIAQEQEMIGRITEASGARVTCAKTLG